MNRRKRPGRLARLTRAALAAALVGTCAAPLSAAEESVIVVTAARGARTVDETLASVTVIDREAIEKSGARSLPELLSTRLGLRVDQSGGRGTLSGVRLRGTESRHLLLLIDGVRFGSATSGSAPFEHIPLAQIDRIEIVRGPRSSLYGSDAVGGILQIFTHPSARSGRAAPNRATFSYGTHNAYSAAAGIGGGGEQGGFDLRVGYLRDDGIDATKEGVVGHEGDRDGHENRSLSLRLQRRVDEDLSVGVRLLHLDSVVEIDDQGYHPVTFAPINALNDRQKSASDLLSGTLEYAPSERWLMKMQAGVDASRRAQSGDRPDVSKTRRLQFSWQNDLFLDETQSITVGLDALRDQISGTTAYDRNRRDNRGYFAHYQKRRGAHDFALSWRYDDNEQFGGHATENAAWGYALSPELRLTAAYGSAFVAPTFDFLYWPGFSNPDLRPERSQSVELGLSGARGAGRWSLHAYRTELTDLIVNADTDGDGFVDQPQNASRAAIAGVEAEIGLRIARWSARLLVEQMAPINREAGAHYGNLLPRRSKRQAALTLERAIGRGALGLSWKARSSAFDDPANRVALAGYGLLDLHGEYRLDKKWALRGRIGNLFDKGYETVSGYNQPGREIFLSLVYRP